MHLIVKGIYGNAIDQNYFSLPMTIGISVKNFNLYASKSGIMNFLYFLRILYFFLGFFFFFFHLNFFFLCLSL